MASPAPRARQRDAPAVRYDFSPPAAAADEDSARSYAIAAQSQERMARLISSLAAPSAQPLSPAKVGSANPGVGKETVADSLKVLRGQAEPAGKILDRAA